MAVNVYTSEQIGIWLVSGDYAGIVGYASLTVSDHGLAVSVSLIPDTTSITSGETASYQAFASDVYDNSWDVTGETSFSIEAAACGGWTSNVYRI